MALETIATLETTGKGVSWLWTNMIKPRMNKAKLERKEILDKVNDMHKVMIKELSYNGQSSIKDAVLRIENRIDVIDTKISGIQENQYLSMNLQGIAFWVSNEQGKCTYASTNLCKMLGRTESEIMGDGWAAYIIPEDRNRVFKEWVFSVEHRSAFDSHYTFKRSDGKKQKVWGLAFHKKITETHVSTMGKIEAIGEPF